MDVALSRVKVSSTCGPKPHHLKSHTGIASPSPDSGSIHCRKRLSKLLLHTTLHNVMSTLCQRSNFVPCLFPPYFSPQASPTHQENHLTTASIQHHHSALAEAPRRLIASTISTCSYENRGIYLSFAAKLSRTLNSAISPRCQTSYSCSEFLLTSQLA